MSARFAIVSAAAAEYLRYDLGSVKEPVARCVYATGRALSGFGSQENRARGFRMLMRLHTATFSPAVDEWIIRRLRDATAAERQGEATGLWASYDASIQSAISAFLGASGNPARYIGTRLLVVKSARPAERGVIVVDYSNIFPLLAGLFDLRAIADRYTLVLEPSWAGCCAPEILLFTRLQHPVFVQTIEPRDHHLLNSLGTNLRIVPTAANWWVEPRPAPPPGVVRDIDVAMVASWADMKRHWRFFRVLAELKRRGRRLKVVLVGYAYGRTKADIVALAEFYGIRDQVEAFERISQDEVTALLTRSKIHILWSRRECANRAIIEAMMADVPSIVRDGLTFGFKYPYVNPQTGKFVKEHDLASAILDMLDARDRYSPRDWILQNMSPAKATGILEDHLKEAARAAGEPWTEGLVVRTAALNSQAYLDPASRERFRADYEFLETAVLRAPSAS